MEITATLQAQFDKYLKENATKRAELDAIMEPYKRLIAEIEKEKESLLKEKSMLVGEYGEGRQYPLYWKRYQHNAWKTDNPERIWYVCEYKRGNHYESGASASVGIEARPELKKYKFTVTNTAAKKSNYGYIRILTTNYKNDEKLTQDQQALLADRYQCKTLEEAEATAARLIKIINKLLRASEYYKRLVGMVSSEIDQLETIEPQK